MFLVSEVLKNIFYLLILYFKYLRHLLVKISRPVFPLLSSIVAPPVQLLVDDWNMFYAIINITKLFDVNYNVGIFDKIKYINALKMSNPKTNESRQSYLDKNPFEGMKIDDNSILDKLEGRHPCPKCGKSRKFYCYSCYVPILELEGKLPTVQVGIVCFYYV